MSALDDMIAFVRVVDAGGFSHAAEELGLAKSIVSRRIARLEADLGAKLLVRTTRELHPTEAGIEFLERCRRILKEIEEARASVAGRDGEVTGTLRVTAPVSFGVPHVAPRLADFARRHPKLVVEVSYDDAYVDLVQEGFEAALRIGDLKDSSLMSRRLCPVRNVLAASPEYLRTRGTPREPRDLAGHDCLPYLGAAPEDQWRLRVGRRWMTFRPSGRVRTDNGEALCAAAVAGLGIVALPTFIVGEALKSGSLVRVLTAFETPDRGLHVVWPTGAPSARLRALIDYLVRHFSHPDGSAAGPGGSPAADSG